MAVVKLTQIDIYNLYVDPERHFSLDQFQHFVDLVEFKSNTLPVVWYAKPTTQMDYDAFYFKEQFYMLHKIISALELCPWSPRKIGCQDAKNQCIFAAKGLRLELDKTFLTHELMNATSIVYPQYWVQPEVALMFLTHLQIFKSHCCYRKLIEPNVKSHVGVLDHFFMTTM